MKKAESTSPDQNPAKLGVLDFNSFVNDTEPEWTLFAVKAPFEQVAKALADYVKPDRWLRDVPRTALYTANKSVRLRLFAFRRERLLGAPAGEA